MAEVYLEPVFLVLFLAFVSCSCAMLQYRALCTCDIMRRAVDGK